MQHLEYTFGPYAPLDDATDPSTIVGVVGSGNLEAFFERKPQGGMIRFVVDTSIAGFEPTWQAVLRDFAERVRRGDLLVTINDAGATPPVVALRLAQAADELAL